MPVVMESDMRAGIRIDARSRNNGSAKVTPNVLGDDRRIAVIGFSVDIEPFAMIFVNGRFNLLKRRTEYRMKPVKKSGTERFSEKLIIKVFNLFPWSNTPNSDFRD